MKEITDKNEENKYRKYYRHFANINGISALLAASTISFLYPFEVLKFRMQCKWN